MRVFRQYGSRRKFLCVARSEQDKEKGIANSFTQPQSFMLNNVRCHEWDYLETLLSFHCLCEILSKLSFPLYRCRRLRGYVINNSIDAPDTVAYFPWHFCEKFWVKLIPVTKYQNTLKTSSRNILCRHMHNINVYIFLCVCLCSYMCM